MMTHWSTLPALCSTARSCCRLPSGGWQPTDPNEVWHPVSLSSALLRKTYGTSMIRVNSTHHQAVDDPGSLEVAGRAPDGVIEAVVAPDHRCAVGLQWHPEYLDMAPFAMLAHFTRR